MKRLLVNLVTGGCVVLCVALVALWVRSYFRAEFVTYRRIVDRRAGVTWVQASVMLTKGTVQASWETDHLSKGSAPSWVEAGGWERETHPAGEFLFDWVARHSIADRVGFAWTVEHYRGTDGSFMKQRRAATPVWAAVVVLGVLPAVREWKRARRVPPRCCARCGYDLTGNESGVCPECGEAKGEPAR